jgi:hypothetical protein
VAPGGLLPRRPLSTLSFSRHVLTIALATRTAGWMSVYHTALPPNAGLSQRGGGNFPCSASSIHRPERTCIVNLLAVAYGAREATGKHTRVLVPTARW